MDRAQAEALVTELGQQLGIESLALDARGSCTLAIDEEAVIVTIGHKARTGTIDLMICLDEIEATGARLVRVLGANFAWLGTGGATFALEPGSGALILQRRLVDQELQHGGLGRALQSLVAMAETWTRQLATIKDAGPADDEVGPALDPGRIAQGVLRA
jgi:hypothetical protein